MADYQLSSKEIRDLINTYDSAVRKLRYQIDKTENTIKELREVLPRIEAEETSQLTGRSVREKKASVSPPETNGSPEPADVGATEMQESEAAPQEDEGNGRRRRRRVKAVPPKPRDKGKPEGKGKRGRGAGKKSAAAAETTAEAPSAGGTETSESPAKEKKSTGKRGRPRKVKAEGEEPKKKAGRKGKSSDKSASGYRLSTIDNMIIEALTQRGKVMINSELLDYVENKADEIGEQLSADEIKLRISRSLQKLVNRRGDLVKVPYEGRGFAYALPKWLDGDNVKNKFQR